MKRIIAATAVAAALAAGSTQAGQTSGTFNVDINLTSACTLTAVADLAFAYTSLQAGASNATGGGFSVSCTTSLPYTFALRAGTPAGPFVAPFVTTLGPITDSVVNLDYSLSVGAGGTGNGTPQAYSVTGTMAGNQSGTCALATCTNAGATNRTHTLIVNY
jgi:spore coat protein U-like protein